MLKYLLKNSNSFANIWNEFYFDAKDRYEKIISLIEEKIETYKLHIAQMEKASEEQFKQQIIADSIRMCTLNELLNEIKGGVDEDDGIQD